MTDPPDFNLHYPSLPLAPRSDDPTFLPSLWISSIRSEVNYLIMRHSTILGFQRHDEATEPGSAA